MWATTDSKAFFWCLGAAIMCASFGFVAGSIGTAVIFAATWEG